MWFKSKKTKQLEKLFNDSIKDMYELEKKLADTTELVQLYKKQIETLSAKPLFSPENYIHVPIPANEDDNKALLIKTAAFTTDTLYLFYFGDIRRRIIQQFESDAGRVNPEFYRGQLALIGEMFDDSVKARKHLGNA